MTDLELEARNALDVLAMLTETRPGNVRLNALDTLTRALKAARADAQALADVRTLDTVWCCYDGPQRGRWYVVQGNVVALHKQPQDVYPPRFFDGATPDEARAAAAKWVREQKGERP